MTCLTFLTLPSENNTCDIFFLYLFLDLPQEENLNDE